MSTSVAAGTSASFSAAASGTPAPSVQWQVSTDAGASWSAIAGASAASYSFTADAGANGNEYRAAFTNAAGSATSAAATLTVTGAGGASAPAITANPADDTVPSGAGASFSAAASGTPAPGVQWQLSTDAGASWSAIAGATGTTYAFTASGAENGDRYRAVFSNGSGSATSAGATLTIAEQSTNWSGYYAWNGPFSAVTGTWTVPSVTCGSATTYSSQWIGIDGASDDTVEQDGTEADCSGGGAYYGAWYEMYGDSSVDGGYEVPLAGASHPVAAGDSMSASVSLSGATWTLEIADATEGWNYSVGIAQPSPAPQQASAEWIVERPEICSESCELANLSQFASVGFSAAAATTGSGAEPIGGLDESAIEMTSSDRSTVLAAPGPLSTGGSGFYDSWLASS
ncbi:MAG TPA: G1 family glutamic endopeptidase [Solirubrobacteraceae bacterium]|nr:G1 family glutamic endopeptidase [Solirubrobacteraceae bacterium]